MHRSVNTPRTAVLRFVSPLVALVLIAIACMGCARATPAAVVPTLVRALPTDTIAPSSLPAGTASLAPTAAVIDAHPKVVVLASGLPEPDDLLLAPDGSILISDVKDGTIRQYSRDGQLRVLLSGLNEPEGMAFAPDGSLIIVEQGNNRLVRHDFASKTLAPFLDLVNHTPNAGVDNIMGSEAGLIVPDSPNGNLLELSWDGRTTRQLASGLVRPTGAWLEAGGSILLADEYGNAILRLHPDGRLQKLADLSVPDDVIADAAGNIFATTLGDGAVHLLAASSGQDVLFVGGLSQPQGIVFDPDGNLIVTDTGHHELLRVLIH